MAIVYPVRIVRSGVAEVEYRDADTDKVIRTVSQEDNIHNPDDNKRIHETAVHVHKSFSEVSDHTVVMPRRYFNSFHIHNLDLPEHVLAAEDADVKMNGFCIVEYIQAKAGAVETEVNEEGETVVKPKQRGRKGKKINHVRELVRTFEGSEDELVQQVCEDCDMKPPRAKRYIARARKREGIE